MSGRRASGLGLIAALAALVLVAVLLLREDSPADERAPAARPEQAEASALPEPGADAAQPLLQPAVASDPSAANDAAQAALAAQRLEAYGNLVSITGRVTDDADRPQPGARVLLVPDALTLQSTGHQRQGGSWLTSLPRDSETMTDADGRFTLQAKLMRRGPLDSRPAGVPEDPWLVAGLAGFAPTGFACRDIVRRSFDAGTLRLVRGGAVAGRVVDEHGAPLQGAQVAFPVQHGWGRYFRPPDEIEALLYVGTTDAAGRFEVGELPAMWLEGTASLPDRRPASWPAFELQAGQLHELPDLVLQAGASVAGLVLLPDGQPVPQAEVLALPLSAQERSRPEAVELRTRMPVSAARGEVRTETGPDGRFALRGLDGANRTLVARVPGWACAVAHDVGNGVEDLVLRLGQPAVLEVHVVDRASGQPVEATLLAAPEVPPRSGDPLPLHVERAGDEAGHYRVLDAAAAGTRLVATEAGHARATAVAPGLQPGEHAEFTLELDRGAVLAGRVVDEAGRPLALASVALLGLPDDTARRTLAMLGYVSRETALSPRSADKPGQVLRPARPCNATGGFVFDQLPAGRYAVRAAAFGCVQAESEPVDVSVDQPASELVLTLRAGGDVRGALLNGDGTPGVSDIWLQPASGGDERNTVTDNTGHFVLHGVPPGEWSAHATAARAVPVTVVAGQVAEVVIQRDATSRLIVQVSAAGAPVADARVTLKGEGLPLIGLQTDAAGRCEVPVPPRSYAVQVFSPRGGQASRSVLLLPGETQTLSIAMPGGRIVVEAHEAGTGAPAAGVPLRVALVALAGAAPNPEARPGPWRASKPVLTGADGRGTLEQLDAGTWSLTAGGEGWIAATPQTVEVGEQPAVVRVELRRAPIVRVRVLAADGTPAPPGTAVTLSRGGGKSHAGRTDAAGWYECRELEEAGAWTVAVPGSGGAAGALAQGVVQAVEGQTTEVTLTLPLSP